MQPPRPPPRELHDPLAERRSREDEEEREERMALGRIVLGFQSYKRLAELEVARWETNYFMLPDKHKALLKTSQPAKFMEVRRCIHINQFFINSMLHSHEPDAEEGADTCGGPPSHLRVSAAAKETAEAGYKVTLMDHDKIRYVLKNLSRDWSSEGAKEREQSYGPILRSLEDLLGPDLQASIKSGGAIPPPSVLVPGAGLGRLACEIAGLGMQAQGCEFSYHMLLTSSFVLNCLDKKDLYTIHPWIHSNCNQLSDADQMRPILIPDRSPNDLVQRDNLLSMCAGDFLDVFSHKQGRERQVFDAVVTCFFIDTAHNVLDYLETIHHSLRQGGYWINLGPLLYHWADSSPSDNMSIELSLEEIRRCALEMGFGLIREESGVQANYLNNEKALYRGSQYNASLWVMRKE